ncbi:protein SUPPRESSOR OF GENE SILENCING [Trifolium repens]|nr:protein SUPPRESSOR OF GENE SILENCING [Trifolium repens]
MAGGNHPKSSSSSHRKTRWESNSSVITITTTKSPSDPKSKPNSNIPNPNSKPNPNPSPKLPNDHPALIPFQFPEPGPPPPPAYGFHMLERRTIILADGSVRSYFALPPDYQDFAPPPRPLDRFGFPPGPGRHPDYQNPIEAALGKRKYGEDGRDEFARQREQLLRNANGFANRVPGGEFPPGPSGPIKRDTMDPVDLRPSKHLRVDGVGSASANNANARHSQIDQGALKKTFLHFFRLINENPVLKKSLLEDGKQGRVQCVACGSSNNRFYDIHALIMHTYNPDNADSRADHLGLHRALCVFMGWNHSKPPDNSKAYQYLSADEAEANRDDLIMWPPLVIIHNTNTGKSRDGRMEGLGNKWMDGKIRELGIVGGKSKAVYGKEGHLGITLVKFAGDKSGLEAAMRLAEHFKKENHGRKDWARVQAQTLGKDDENNPNLVKVDERKGEKMRILYGYLGTAFDLDKLDFETRKKIELESRREYKPSM